MRSIYFTVGIAFAILVGVISFNTFTSANEDIQMSSVSLNQNENLFDLVYDKDGKLLNGTLYQWDSQSNTRGEAIASLID